MGGKYSVRKGKQGEREVVNILRKQGVNCSRASYAQHSAGAPDVLVQGVSIEVKRVETPKLRQWTQTMEELAKQGMIPVTVWRRNRGRWIVIAFLEDLPKVTKVIVPEGMLQTDTEDRKTIVGEDKQQ